MFMAQIDPAVRRRSVFYGRVLQGLGGHDEIHIMEIESLHWKGLGSYRPCNSASPHSEADSPKLAKRVVNTAGMVRLVA